MRPPLLLFGLEWRVALARRRLFTLNVVIPLLLVVPIALGAAPAFHAAAVYAVLFTLFGTFGSAIPMVRDADTGLVERMMRAGLAPGSLVLQRAGVHALLDAIQLAPALLVAWLAAQAPAPTLLAVAAALATTLWISNLLGALVAALARSVAEAALFAATSALLLLHASGVFRTPTPGGVGARVEAAAPFRALHESLLALTTGAPANGAYAMVVWALVLPLALALLARALLRSLSRAYRA